ncbi:alpha/beta fold hydrolase [Hydrogenophaga laconesensis]|uniref:Pimeloyl-ACP methyl ester carboxylesterase n=1 Tax=Hydrogenophaga laconesensis TaxID=1805971 RepID=A0ABU1V6R1_9BURK|nr:alpha/beta hydrolase [Hydrogenophaga laconesensis]MDR7093080.1 pimeloyl-ACP methyl ester carboxylesterase [Hydrogenophaga laconesensis]
MKRVEIEGVGLEVAHIPGTAERAPLVFLHEGLGSVAMWNQRGQHWPADLCAATGRAGWLYSRRGYGQSDPVTDVRGPPDRQGRWHTGRHEPDYMHREAWDVLPELLNKLGIARPVLIGHSDGATIALLHASRHAVTGCVAMAPHVFIEDIALRAIAQARTMYESETAGLRQRLARYHADVDNAFWQWNDVWLSEAFRHFDIRSECRTITAPLLLVQGLSDEYGTMAQLDEIARAAPQARRLELPDCGHSPHRDQPAALTRATVDFLSGLP